MNKFHQIHNYLNKSFELLINQEIYEYDIKSAGFNILKKFNLIDDKIVSELEILPKKMRQKRIGKMCRRDRDLIKKLNFGFCECRRQFYEANDLCKDDILSVKKDAIFTFKPCVNVEFGNILFVKKNIYNSYLYLDKKEFYCSNNILDVKGIKDETLNLHKEYMCDYIYTILNLLNKFEQRKAIKLMTDFNYLYRGKHLPIGYYREFNIESKYRHITETQQYGNLLFDYVGNADDIDISYNYINIMTPLQSIII